MCVVYNIWQCCSFYCDASVVDFYVSVSGVWLEEAAPSFLIFFLFKEWEQTESEWYKGSFHHRNLYRIHTFIV